MLIAFSFFLSFRPIAPIEYVPRHHRLGLGAVKAPEIKKEKKYIKPGESREPQVCFNFNISFWGGRKGISIHKLVLAPKKKKK